MIKIVVDSICDLPDSLYQELNLTMIPLHVLLEEQEYRDKVDIHIDEIYRQMRQGALPKTTQIPPVDIIRVLWEFAQQGDDFIFLTFSAVMSGTYNVAQTIAEEIKKNFPMVHMAVIDSKAGSLGIGLMAIQAVQMVNAGLPFSEIVNNILFMTQHVEHIFSIADMEWLVRGGRVNKVVGKAGSIIDIKPILDVEDGYIKVIGAGRGKKKTIQTLINLTKERIQNFPNQLVGIAHADDFDTALEIKTKLQEQLGVQKFIIARIGCVLAAHLGLSGVGILFFNQEPPFYQLDETILSI